MTGSGSASARLLLEVISARAREEGIKTFTALMLATNREMMLLLKELDPVRVVDREKGTSRSRCRSRRSGCHRRSGS